MTMHPYAARILAELTRQEPHQTEFLQAVSEVFSTLAPALERHPEWEAEAILERLVIPERTVSFRVVWLDDGGAIRVNRGWRVQFSSAIGPYKGGLRFHPSVNPSILKFLGFEQIFKNSLTGLSLGGGKGGSDFSPRGKSDREVMRFCQSFMIELARHIGADIDVPAGDIGVGAREIGYLFGQYKRLTGSSLGALTGKGLSFGGSLIRTEATGYGLCYFLQQLLQEHDQAIAGKSAVVSGSGNVALHAAEKLTELGGRVIAMSDSDGYVYDPDGIDPARMKAIKLTRRGRVSDYAREVPSARFQPEGDIWRLPCQLALPCATQNELDEADARALMKNGVIAVAEGANMPVTPPAVARLQQSGVLFAPAKAANAGGVAVSGLEMSQNSQRLHWSRQRVDGQLQQIMAEIYRAVSQTAASYERPGDLLFGANVAGLEKVADAMLWQGAAY